MHFSILVALVCGHDLENRYVVKLKGHRAPIQAHLHQVQSLFKARSTENAIHRVYTAIGNMYSAQFTGDVLGHVAGMADVEYVRREKVFSINTVQENATWGLARISQVDRLVMNATSYNYTYASEGANTTVYIVDTGIMAEHPEFEGRARFGARFAGDRDTDEHGHGTHCAGTVGSKTFGVAKRANLVGVRVLDSHGDGTTADIVAGLDWVVAEAAGRPGSVLTMSLGGDDDLVLNDAVEAVVAKGIVVVVAAGNENIDACRISPANAPSVITVGATNIRDMRAYFSNYGECVDVFAPGSKILSTWNDGLVKSMDGTSMAAPYVAGLAAVLLSQNHATPAEISSMIVKHASKDMITNITPESPNLLASNLFAES